MSAGFEDMVLLPPRERLIMIGQLWDSLGSEDIVVTQAQKDELSRRLESLDKDRAEGVSWAELKADLARQDS